jgi:hypothetical protein
LQWVGDGVAQLIFFVGDTSDILFGDILIDSSQAFLCGGKFLEFLGYEIMGILSDISDSQSTASAHRSLAPPLDAYPFCGADEKVPRRVIL